MRVLLIAMLTCVIGAAAAHGGAAPATTQALPQPTRVTLKLDDVPAAAGLRELFELARIPTDGLRSAGFVQRMEGMTVRGNFVDHPFNLALLELCRQCGVEPEHSPAPGKAMGMIIRPVLGELVKPTTRPVATTTVTRVMRRPLPARVSRALPSVGNGVRLYGPDASWVDGPSVAAGPFVVVARGARRTSRVELEAAPPHSPQRDLELTFMVMRDPGVRVFAIASRLEVEEARDEHGRSLLPPAQKGAPPSPASTGNDQTIWPVTASLAYPSADARTLALLRGKLHVSLVTRSEPVELLADGKTLAGSRKVGDFEVSAEALRDSGEGSEMPVKITVLGGVGNATQETWQVMRALLHGDGLVVSGRADGLYWADANVHSFTNNNTYGGTIRFRPYQAFQGDPKAARRPSKVVWHVPVEVTDLAIPLEFFDLPLP